MSSSTVSICVLTLVLLSIQQICRCMPHRSERGLRVKDYFQPDTLVFSSDKFEKGEDGKYYLKKSAYRSDSEVKYSSPENGENSLADDAKPGDAGGVQTGESAEGKLVKEEATEKVVSEVPLTSPIIEEAKVTEEIRISPKPESVMEGVAKTVEGDDAKAPFTPAGPKMVVKPDSKDEVPLKTGLPPMSVEEKVPEKVAIGQVPDLYSRLVPMPGTFRMPVLIPIRQVSYGSVKVLPLPPADVSDRLPLPYEDDIMGEGAHESESEEVSQPISEERKGIGYHLGNPLAIGMPPPALNFQGFLKDVKEAGQQNSEKQSKVVDVLGKKFLMQSNVMKYPTGDNSHMFLRFLSMKPLTESKPKEISTREDMAGRNSKELDMDKEEAAAREVLKKEEGKIESEMAKEESLIESEMKKEGLLKEQEVLKAEEAKLKVDVEEEVPEEVILRNMGGPEVKIQESVVKEGDAVDEMKIHSMEYPLLIATDEKSDKALEKAESQVVEVKAAKDESVSEGFGEELMKKDMVEEKSVPAEVDALLKKEHAEKEMEMGIKKDFSQMEKTKKVKFTEENEKGKPKKKSDKKKKCKCEDDSDDDEE